MKNSTLINYYLMNQRKRKLSKATIESTKRILFEFNSYLSLKEDMIVPKKEQYNYLESMWLKNSKSTVYSKTNIISNFLDFYVYRNIIKENPFAYTDIHYHHQPSNDILYKEELLAFLTEIDDDKNLTFPDRYLLNMFIATVAKTNEILSLKADKIELENESIYFYVPKDNRFLIGNNYLYEQYDNYFYFRKTRMKKFKQKHDHLLITNKGAKVTFYHVTKLFREISEHYQIKISPLKLRRSMIAYLINQKMDILYLKVLLGHKSVSSTNYYTQLRYETLREAIYDYLPRGRKKIDE
ncbi:tyrosine-type recombinase/integrase [Tetragenococcus solitarius]|uniref:Tyrosine recombinase XerC n=1 Tax=Tetragenococcus solitarius TaxID=71453 RepID=A0ABP6KKB5_9ENTE|nr:tyrosine-type recombinase/integrase [Tetragenococcus solitarius]